MITVASRWPPNTQKHVDSKPQPSEFPEDEVEVGEVAAEQNGHARWF